MPDDKSSIKAPAPPEIGSPSQENNSSQRINSTAEPTLSTAVASKTSNGADKAAPALLSQVSESLEKLGKQIGECVEHAGKEGVPPLLLMTSYLQSQALTRKLTTPDLRPASQMASALEALLKKLHENPKNATAYTLHTALAAVQVLKDLCVAGVNPDLAAKPAISILVVDDEPLTRRAIVVVLQTAFLKPDGAEDGEAALALAEKKPFDVIFMDVQMPGMDGFTACGKIHETAANRKTPILFVTSQTDEKSRAQSELCGGSDFVTKPFIFVEITVKALTYALRGRLTAAK
jgi:CheY-like chemotaxis protein